MVVEELQRRQRHLTVVEELQHRQRQKDNQSDLVMRARRPYASYNPKTNPAPSTSKTQLPPITLSSPAPQLNQINTTTHTKHPQIEYNITRREKECYFEAVSSVLEATVD
jgi:hypothetical protein